MRFTVGLLRRKFTGWNIYINRREKWKQASELEIIKWTTKCVRKQIEN